MALVTLEHVCKNYPGSTERAVDDVNLVAQDGEFMVLLGPSGCGKSTTLRMIAGLETISEGTLAIDGRVMNDVPAKDRDIAMVFQSYALYPHMSVKDNLAFGLRRRRIAAGEIERRVSAVASTLGLTPFLDRKPFALSGGQRQRVALGRAIVREPAVFLFDEPLSNLDAALRVSTRNELIKLHHRLKSTMIYVTHDQVEAMTMGTRICIMNKGQVAQIGAPLDVYRQPADMFVAGFLGNPPMNLLNVEMSIEHGEPAIKLAGQAIPLANLSTSDVHAHVGRPVVFGIRPEDIYTPQDLRPGMKTMEFPAQISAIEPLGAETLIMAAIEGASRDLSVRAGRDFRGRIGERVTLCLDVDASHVFDPETTKVIAPRESEALSFIRKQANA